MDLGTLDYYSSSSLPLLATPLDKSREEGVAGEVGEETDARQVLHRLEHVQLYEETAVEEKDERQAAVKENRRDGQLKGGQVDANFGPLDKKRREQKVSGMERRKKNTERGDEQQELNIDYN